MKFLYLIALLPGVVSAQIGLEFLHDKINGNPVQSISEHYENVQLDKDGNPILEGRKPDHVTTTLLKDGYPIDIRWLEFSHPELKISAIRQVFEREGAEIRKAAIYMDFDTKENILREHRTVFSNGRLSEEKIYYPNNKLVGTAKYSYGKTAAGNEFTRVEEWGNRGGNRYLYHEFDKNWLVTSLQYTETDTLISTKRIDIQGDTLKHFLIVAKRGGDLPVRDSALQTTKLKLDAHGNTVFLLESINMLTDLGEPDVPHVSHSVTVLTIQYDGKPDNSHISIPKKTDLNGAWRNENDNVELYLSERLPNQGLQFYTSFMRGKPQNPTETPKDRLWKHTAFVPGVLNTGDWTFNEKTGKLEMKYQDGSTLSFSAVFEWKTLVLKPLFGSGLEDLRLVRGK